MELLQPAAELLQRRRRRRRPPTEPGRSVRSARATRRRAADIRVRCTTVGLVAPLDGAHRSAGGERHEPRAAGRSRSRSGSAAREPASSCAQRAWSASARSSDAGGTKACSSESGRPVAELAQRHPGAQPGLHRADVQQPVDLEHEGVALLLGGHRPRRHAEHPGQGLAVLGDQPAGPGRRGATGRSRSAPRPPGRPRGTRRGARRPAGRRRSGFGSVAAVTSRMLGDRRVAAVPDAPPPATRVRPAPRQPATRTSRSSSAPTTRTGLRVHRRHLLDRARPGARRHPLLPVRRRGGRAGRRARAVPGDGLQERAGRAGPRRRQGGHHRRPGGRTRPRRCCGPTAGSWSRLGGRYVTACDVGTYVADMDVVRAGDPVRHRPVPGDHGGAGDSSVLTAYGVFQGMRAGAEHLWGTPTLAGRTVGIAGVGKVGRHLVGHLVEDGATRGGHRRVGGGGRGGPRRRTRRSRSSPTRTRWCAADLDVYSPCALGHALTDEVVRGAAGPARLRRGQQPAGPPGHRGAAGRPRASSTPRTTA